MQTSSIPAMPLVACRHPTLLFVSFTTQSSKIPGWFIQRRIVLDCGLMVTVVYCFARYILHNCVLNTTMLIWPIVCTDHVSCTNQQRLLDFVHLCMSDLFTCIVYSFVSVTVMFARAHTCVALLVELAKLHWLVSFCEHVELWIVHSHNNKDAFTSEYVISLF